MPRPSKLSVLFIGTSNAGTQFYRMWQFRENMLHNKLVKMAAMPWFHYGLNTAQPWQWDSPHDYASQPCQVFKSIAQQVDVVVVQYLHTMEALTLIECLKQGLRDSGKNIPFLTEIDDYVHETPVDFQCFEDYKPGNKYRMVVEEQIKNLDGVIVSTPYLKEVYSEFNPHVYIVPNAIDFKAWDKIPKFHSKTETRIGWSGGGNHREDLLTIERPVKKYLEENKKVELHMVHGIPEEFKDQSKIVWHKQFVSMKKYAKRLAKVGFDIGLAPLACNDFKKAKSNLRRLEYAALGIPVLAQKWGHMADTVENGKDGFLYETEEEFTKCLDVLVKNETLRRDLGRHNYLTAKRDYSLDTVTKHYVEVLKEAVSRGQTTTIDMESKRTEVGVA
jgi:glycosyltransferase involved in cell wall biosynthesis